MDWLVDPHDPRSGERALGDIGAHLRRHTAFESAVEDALPTLGAALAALSAEPPHDRVGALLRVNLNWFGRRPEFTFGTVVDPAVAERRSLTPGEVVPVEDRPALDAASSAVGPRITLDVERRPQETFDNGMPPMARVRADPRRDGVASVAVALAAAAEAHPAANSTQTASLAGAALADSVAGGRSPQDAQTVARLLVEAHRGLGSDAEVVAADDRRVEITMSRCPFGHAVQDGRALCHVSTGLAGRLGARVNGTATVMLDESMAAGDNQCHLQVWLDDSHVEVQGEEHQWPPSARGPDGPAPQLDLSLNLPRESGSVPVVRRLAAQALTAFGVEGDDVYDVQLAITEACANVIDHAADTDTYEVKVELAADRCAITVVDQGGGFDATAVPPEAALSAEQGRGLSLMRALVDNLAFQEEPQVGAVVHMVKSLRYDPTHPLWQRAPTTGSRED
jgi:serine/threonine-protein kinase RsbW